MSPTPIGQYLVDHGLVSREDIESALRVQQEVGDRLLGLILVDSGYASEAEIIPLLAGHLGVDHVRLKGRAIAPELIAKVPVRCAHFYRVVPVDETPDGALRLAMPDPQSLRKVDDLELLLGTRIVPVLCGEQELAEALKQHYGIGADTVDRMVASGTGPAPRLGRGAAATDLEELAGDASVVQFVNQVLREAYRDRATDIHFEPSENRLRIRYRIDGILYDAAVPREIHQFHQAIVSRLKVMAELDIAERRLPQDGRIKVRLGSEELDLRISVLPSSYGEAINVRLLGRTSMLLGLENLGFQERELDLLGSLIQRPHGIVLVTGPTGSGKTTTLYACLNRIDRDRLKIITIEDPIEYQISGVTQVQVHPKIGLTFSNGLRSMLRHDPDVMMVGEIRDVETAEITIRVALTGHLVFSTLHTNDAASAVTRLLDMGVEPYLASSSVECVIAQRLVRLICPHCREEAPGEREILAGIGREDLLKDGVLYHGRGCEQCRGTGFQGRTAITEFLPFSDEVRDLVVRRAAAGPIKDLGRQQGMKTLREAGFEKVLAGVTTVGEVLRVTQEEKRL